MDWFKTGVMTLKNSRTLVIDGKQGTALFTDQDQVTITDHQGAPRSFHRK